MIFTDEELALLNKARDILQKAQDRLLDLTLRSTQSNQIGSPTLRAYWLGESSVLSKRAAEAIFQLFSHMNAAEIQQIEEDVLFNRKPEEVEA